jgi:hypothetical protein
MSETRQMPGLPDPSWADQMQGPGPYEEWCLEWRERHGLAAIELAEMCGLVCFVLSRPQETEADKRSQERVDDVFKALQTLIEIDPDARR